MSKYTCFGNFWQRPKNSPQPPFWGEGGQKGPKTGFWDILGPFSAQMEGKMDGAIGFSGEKSTGKVILEPIAKNKVEFVTLCNI